MRGFSAHTSPTAIAGADHTLESGCLTALARCGDDAVHYRPKIRSAINSSGLSIAISRWTRPSYAVIRRLEHCHKHTSASEASEARQRPTRGLQAFSKIFHRRPRQKHSEKSAHLTQKKAIHERIEGETNRLQADFLLRHVKHARLVRFSLFPNWPPLTSSASEP
jgi:hypothetical protein